MKILFRNKNLHTCLVILFLIWNTYASSQNQAWQWARSVEGSGDESVTGMATDAQGNVYATGFFYGSTLAVGTTTLVNAGNYDFFVIKFDPSGNLLWARSGGGIYDEVGMGITTDGSGNAYVTGYLYSPTMVVGNFTVTNAGVGDMFAIKYNSAGTEMWANGIGGSGEDNGTAIACDPSGNLLVTGFFKSATLVIGTSTLTKSVGEDLCVIKLDSSGNPLWAEGFEGTGNDRGNGISSDSDGNILVTGQQGGAMLILGSDTLLNSGSSDAFLTKLTSSGTVLWSRSMGGLYNDFGNSVTTDFSGNVVVTGTFNSPTLSVSSNSLLNNGGFDFFVAKYSSTGTILWAKVGGGIFDDTGYGIATNFLGHVFVTGHFHSPSIIIGSDTLFDEGIGDLYVVGYASNGNEMWTKHLGGTADDGSGALTCDDAGNLLLGGYFISPTVSCPEFTLTNSGNQDLLVAKLKIEYNFTGIPFSKENSLLRIYPNPSTGVFHIEAGLLEPLNVTILNELGQPVIYSSVSDTDTRIDLSDQPPGIFLVKINVGDKFLISRLILR
ncbi:MAG: T9SS type A sorting domain-containing protein [bacterium]|nr:T9SS type A sorting domain-containing protein [bacterium]